MKKTLIQNALIAAGLLGLVGGSAAASIVIVPGPADPLGFGNSPVETETASADDAMGPLSHTDQGKAKGPQSASMPSFGFGSTSGVDGLTNSPGMTSLGAVVIDDEPMFRVPEFGPASVTSAAKLTRAEVIRISTVTGAGVSIGVAPTAAVPAPGAGVLLVAAGLVGLGRRRRS